MSCCGQFGSGSVRALGLETPTHIGVCTQGGRRDEAAAPLAEARDATSRRAARSLTGTERAVSLLVAGADERAVARRLFISPRIVDAHLLRMFARLGVPGRVALAAVVRH